MDKKLSKSIWSREGRGDDFAKSENGAKPAAIVKVEQSIKNCRLDDIRKQYFNSLGSQMKSDFKNIILRPEQSGDESLLFDIYAATRQDELDLTGWDAARRAVFLNMQFKAMRQGYRAMFPTAQSSIILHETKTVGRMVIDRMDRQIHVVDLALLPEFRNQKIGSFLMGRVCDEAVGANKIVTLSVFKNSRPIHWYHRLGFSTIGEAGFYEKMEWRPTVISPP